MLDLWPSLELHGWEIDRIVRIVNFLFKKIFVTQFVDWTLSFNSIW